MILTRRGFTGGLLGLAATGAVPPRAFAQSTARFEPAIAAIRAYAGAHVSAFGLPGLIVGLIAPGGFAATFDLGHANRDSRSAIGADTLFQVGSITKLMTALVIHQLAAEGKFALSDPIDRLLPTIPLPSGETVTVQQLLDHRSGLPADAPLFPPGGLWTGFKPGSAWSYSNTGYDILGKLAEVAGGKPLVRLLEERLFRPLGMGRTRGSIMARDRASYAQGYEAANNAFPYARGVPLAPAGWVDVTFGAGSVASTAADMNLLFAAISGAARGGSLPGLNPAQTAAYLTHAAPTDSPAMNYGNGLMHVGDGPRRYLHHTGGMVSFSSAFHLDLGSGTAAFASASLTGFTGYRPKLLSKFAVDALTNAITGRPLPIAPRLDDRLAGAAGFVGRYSGAAGAFEVLPGAPLTISAGGRSAPLQPWGGTVFRTTHPDFARFSLMFERVGGKIVAAAWGPDQFARVGSGARPIPPDPALARLAGRYVNDSPWWGVVELVERGGKLWLGTEVPLVSIGANLWRVGDDRKSPERAAFADAIDGRPQTLLFSGEKFVRHDI
ncbi:MAG: serine hydrolase domain-containing protein [Sphingomicrobium sp.]